MDIKEVISLLCTFLNNTVDSELTAEHFKLAKYNKHSEDINGLFWSALDKITYYALKEVNDSISFDDFDPLLRTQLRLAYLQYPAFEIYRLTESTRKPCSRYLLIALSWLISKHHVIENIVRLKLITSSLGREFSKFQVKDDGNVIDARLATVDNQINYLLHKANKLSDNLKAISELYIEKIKLMTKVHAASITTSGLPHLTVAEMSLIKKMATTKEKSRADIEKIKEMEKTAALLDMTMKWVKKRSMFYAWMSTVLDEYEREQDDQSITDEELTALYQFIYLLRHLIKKKLKALKRNNKSTIIKIKIQDCPSRLLRVQKCLTEVGDCLSETNIEFDLINENVQKKHIELEKALKSILEVIPDCIHV